MSDDFYHDDPIEEKPNRKLRNNLLAPEVLIIGSLFFFQSTLASNLSLNSGLGLEFGQGVSQTVACSGSTSLNIIPSAAFVNASSSGTHYLGSITITNIPSACSSSDVFISAYSDSGTTAQTLFGSVTSLPIYDNSGTFYTDSTYSSYLTLTSSSAACVGASGTCYGFTINFKNPTLTATSVNKIVIQSGANIITLNCFQTAKSCTWSKNTLAGSRYWRALASSSDGTKLVAVVYYGDIYTSIDSGATWVDRTPSGTGHNLNWYSVTSSSDGSKLAAVVNPGQIYTSSNSGQSWTLQSGSPGGAWRSITSSSDGTKLAAVIQGSGLYTSTDSGVTWTVQTNAGSRAWVAICSSTDGSVLAAAVPSVGGGIFISTDSGSTWTARASARQWDGVACSGDGSKLAATVTNDYIYLSSNTGVTWAASSSPNRYWLSIASSNDGAKLVAGMLSGASYVYISTNSGATWSAQNSSTVGTTADIYGLTVSGDGNLIAAGEYSGYIYTTTG